MQSERRRRTALAMLATVALAFQPGCGKPLNDSSREYGTVTAPAAKYRSHSPGYTNWWEDWSRELHAGGYQKVGSKNAKWDGPVLAALRYHAYFRVHSTPPPGGSPEEYRAQLKQAIDAGCTDPFVLYIYHRQFVKAPDSANPAEAAEYSRWAQAMDGSGYSSLLKFFVNLRTAEAWMAAFTNQVPEVNRFRRAAMKHLEDALYSEAMPAGAAADACTSLYDVIERNPKLRSDFVSGVENVLFQRWGDEAFPHALKGRYYNDYAWDARGGGWADTVRREGWELFEERLKVAEAELEKAWKIDPTYPPTPLQMMRVELGQGRGRPRLETWFGRAIQFPENRYPAVRWKLWYLQPRWYGNEEECLKFAREVLQSDLYTGQTPLHLYHTHESLADYFKNDRPDYWLEPHVWVDIKAAFERYFTLNGDDPSWRHNYVQCAWRCHQWKAFLEQADKLAWVNYAYFGGEDELNRMKQSARERAAK